MHHQMTLVNKKKRLLFWSGWTTLPTCMFFVVLIVVIIYESSILYKVSEFSAWMPLVDSMDLPTTSLEWRCNNNNNSHDAQNGSHHMEESSSSSKEEEQPPLNLVVFAALGTPSAIATVHYNVYHHFGNQSSSSGGGGDWSCVVFLYVNETFIPNDEPRIREISQVCSLTRVPGWNWAHYLLTLSPAVVRHYQHIAIVLDDVFAPAAVSDNNNNNRTTTSNHQTVSVPRLLKQMKSHNLSTISPSVKGAYWPSLQVVIPKRACLRRVRHIETFFQIFTNQQWNCLHRYLHHANPQGFCLDLCLSKLCPGNFAVDQTMVAYHLGRQYMVHRFVPKEHLEGVQLDYGMRREYPRGIKDEWGVCDQYGCPKDAKHHSNWNEPIVCHPHEQGLIDKRKRQKKNRNKPPVNTTTTTTAGGGGSG